MLRVEGVSKSYDRGLIVLEDVRLHLASGDFAALVGLSGSGKSTLLNLIGLLDRPDRGEIILDGIPVSNLSRVEAARVRNHLIGFVFQSFHLLSRLTAWENVALPLLHRGVGGAERKARALAMLERVGLSDRVFHRPDQMSGGQRQRTAIARALVGEPRLILADEPTGNLDSTTGSQVIELLRSFNRDFGVTVLMITHDRDMAMRCDRVIEIRDGRVLSQEDAG